MGPDARIFVFLMLSFKFYFFTFLYNYKKEFKLLEYSVCRLTLTGFRPHVIGSQIVEIDGILLEQTGVHPQEEAHTQVAVSFLPSFQYIVTHDTAGEFGIVFPA